MTSYSPPVVVDYGDARSLTADSRMFEGEDTFFDANGTPNPGLGASADTCATADGVTCAGS